MKTRWGTCNTRDHRIWLNLYLIKKPIACLEYVLVHEMVHLLEASHNKRFYKLMSYFMPDWQERKKLLAES
jgi:predicted metal-dependent hydrolase